MELQEKMKEAVLKVGKQLNKIFIKDGGVNPISDRVAKECTKIALQAQIDLLDYWINEIPGEHTYWMEKSKENLEQQLKSLEDGTDNSKDTKEDQQRDTKS